MEASMNAASAPIAEVRRPAKQSLIDTPLDYKALIRLIRDHERALARERRSLR
jgi:hypothetical protein